MPTASGTPSGSHWIRAQACRTSATSAGPPTEEINVLEPGFNGGWPCYEGTGQTTLLVVRRVPGVVRRGLGAATALELSARRCRGIAHRRDVLHRHVLPGDVPRLPLLRRLRPRPALEHDDRRHRPPHPGPGSRGLRRGRGRSGGLPPGSQRRRHLCGHHRRHRAPTRVRRREPAPGRRLHHDLRPDHPHRELLGCRLLRPRRRRAGLRLGLRGRRERGRAPRRRTPTTATTRCR